jgi:hypothetical protein
VALVNHQIGSESVVREQGRAAARWQASCVADDALRRRIARLAEDPLPPIQGVCREAIGPSLWGGAGNGETCDTCEEIITKTQFVMEGVSSTTGGKGIQFHVACLRLWDAERRAPGRDDTSAPDELPTYGRGE